MLSIIVSSYKQDYFEQFEKSVQNTVGVPYEIIKVPNKGLMGLCEAYNKGAQSAKYEYVCFSHEDIIFNTSNWGLNVINHFESNPTLGLLGVAGASHKTYVPSGWYPPHMRFIHINLIQEDKSGKSETVRHNCESLQTEVAVIDGCFMCTKKSIWQSVRFDDTLLKGYHCYDLDFSLSVGQSYKVAVVNDILLTHLSRGQYDQKWFVETYKLHKKWKHILPKTTTQITKAEITQQENTEFCNIVGRSFELKLGYLAAFKFFLTLKSFKILKYKTLFPPLLKIIYVQLRKKVVQ